MTAAPALTALDVPRSQPDAAPSASRSACYEADRVLKSGYVQKRAQKTKVGPPFGALQAPPDVP
jgi:hypothetical protein